MKGQGGGGTAKGGGKNRSTGGTVTVKREKEMQTKKLEEKIIHLRKAIFSEDGKDKDVTKGIAGPFLKYDRNGLDVEIAFTHRLTKDEADWAFDVVKCNMEDIYDTSGYGWDDEDKMKELTEGGARFLLVREKPEPGEGCLGPLVAFVHFRFSVQGEVMDEMEGETVLYIWDIHVDDAYQRKGLGRHLLTVLELIARREQMKMIALPVQFSDERTLTWINSKCKGYTPDTSLLSLVGFDAEMEGFEVYRKILEVPKPKPETVATATATPVKKGLVIETPSPCGVTDGPTSPPAPLRSGSIDGQPSSPVVPPFAEWQTLSAKSPSTSPRKMSSSRSSSTGSFTATVIATEDRGTATPLGAVASSPPETDGEWEMVKKDQPTDPSTLGAKEEKEENDQSDLNDSGIFVDSPDADDLPTFVEADIIAQIKRMYIQQNSREPTPLEEAEWLKQIREVDGEEEDAGEGEESEETGHADEVKGN